MIDSATTNFILEAAELPPEPQPTAEPTMTNSVKTGDFVTSFSVLLILVAFAVSVVIHYKMRKASKRKARIKNCYLCQNLNEGVHHDDF